MVLAVCTSESSLHGPRRPISRVTDTSDRAPVVLTAKAHDVAGAAAQQQAIEAMRDGAVARAVSDLQTHRLRSLVI